MRSQYGKNTYLQLGKMVVSRHPELARDIVANYLHAESIETDFSMLPFYFKTLGQLCGPKVQASHKRRLFVSAMLHLYSPGVYHQPNGDLVVRFGFTRGVRKVIDLSEGYTSKMIRQVILHERVYADYRAEVNAIVQALSNLKNLKPC